MTVINPDGQVGTNASVTFTVNGPLGNPDADLDDLFPGGWGRWWRERRQSHDKQNGTGNSPDGRSEGSVTFESSGEGSSDCNGSNDGAGDSGTGGGTGARTGPLSNKFVLIGIGGSVLIGGFLAGRWWMRRNRFDPLGGKR
ncbi:MAG: hypothetical protein ABFC24_12620 [Methanoregulaceae archaeon]